MNLPLEKQCASLEPSKRLRELGYPQEGLFYWYVPNNGSEPLIVVSEKRFAPWVPVIDAKIYSAPTVAELADWQKEVDEKAPWYENGKWWWYDSRKSKVIVVKTDTQANAYAERGILLLEHNLLKFREESEKK